ncbi:MAG: hypothetical protein WAN16_11385 [Chthoniobacterales bacterium]
MALKIISGETLQITVQADIAATVSFVFAGPSKHTVPATGDGGGNFSISASTAGWTAGEYLWEATSSAAGVVKVITRQGLIVAAPLDSVAVGADIRSTARKAVEMLEASLSGSSSAEVSMYRINNRELHRYSVEERIALLAFWRRELSKENRKAAGMSGLGRRIETVI